jgi:hypothetical protein
MGGVAPVPAHDAVELLVVVRPHPGTVVPAELHGSQEVAIPHPLRIGDEQAAVAFGARGDLGDPLGEGGHIRDVRGAGGREVALLGIVGALLVADGVHQLGDEEVEVTIALP